MTCTLKVWGTQSDIANESDVFYGHSDGFADLRFSQSSVASSAWENKEPQDVGVISFCQEKVGKGKATADLIQPLTPFFVSRVRVCV